MTTDSCPLLDTNEAARYLHRSRTTIYRLITRRAIPFSQVGERGYLFRKTDLDAYLQRQRVQSVTEWNQ